MSDTGNSIEISVLETGKLPHGAFPPNGRTFFHRPTGRACDGRLVIDFLGTCFFSSSFSLIFFTYQLLNLVQVTQSNRLVIDFLGTCFFSSSSSSFFFFFLYLPALESCPSHTIEGRESECMGRFSVGSLVTGPSSDHRRAWPGAPATIHGGRKCGAGGGCSRRHGVLRWDVVGAEGKWGLIRCENFVRFSFSLKIRHCDCDIKCIFIYPLIYLIIFVYGFAAEALGLPFLPPYYRYKNGTSDKFESGVNFAVGGAGALNSSFPGIYNPNTNVSLVDEVNSFIQFLNLRTDFKQLLRNSLIVMGEIGGNDYTHAFKQGKSIEDVRNFVLPIVDSITSSINELIELGAVTFLVPGNFPIGCFASYLTLFQGSDKDQYDPLTGCLTWLNQFSQHHNQLLRKELEKIRNLHPDTNIVYADYYSTTLRIYNSPNKFGFKETLKACCGTGGLYNYNLSRTCGYPPLRRCCNDPSSYMSWDGIHYTEAVNRLIANVVFEELMNSIHSLNNLCPASTINELRMIYPKSEM
ncbi:GDSL esterase/lipase At1g28610-like [Gossypium arboreum]|uniref:GDSL esterase/lipase At1g28610-like n=1 Tax=Gossypium arboreum TaxID=29729 RepID=UPI0022F151F9|nr:GDSL esterase/lipase At1g28610-like [Gossypium arboreum]